MALAALLAIGPKYGRRQAGIERKYQARERIVEQREARNNPERDTRKNQLAARRPYATPGDTLVPLWPLAVLLVVVALFAIYMLQRAGASSPPVHSREDSSS